MKKGNFNLANKIIIFNNKKEKKLFMKLNLLTNMGKKKMKWKKGNVLKVNIFCFISQEVVESFGTIHITICHC
jgi:hypothetical protein